MVATEDPDVAANSAEEPKLECINPLDSQLTKVTMPSYMRAAMQARSSTNIGIATKRKSVPVCHTMPLNRRKQGYKNVSVLESSRKRRFHDGQKFSNMFIF